jgi:AcrR family transcriptional regulator
VNKSQATREKLCETAIEIAAREGLAAMTLDNVARHAGVSKGGVTYHFPSKDRLVEAVVEHFGQRLERLVLERVANDPHPRHRWARAMLDCTFDETPVHGPTGVKATRPTTAGKSRLGKLRSEPGDASEAPPPVASRLGVRPADWPDQMLEPLIIERFFLAVLAAATTHPGVIAPLRAVGHRVRERLLADPRDGFDQLLLWLALDGLLLWQFAGLIDRADPLFAQVGRELRSRVDAGFPQSPSPAATPQSQPTTRDRPRRDLPAIDRRLPVVPVATDPRASPSEEVENPVPRRRLKSAPRSVDPVPSNPPAAPARPSRRRNRSS